MNGNTATTRISGQAFGNLNAHPLPVGASYVIPLRLAIVDDKEEVHSAVREMIKSQRAAWSTTHFISGQQALEGLPLAEPHVVLMDVRMPGLSGVECVRHLKRLLPELPVVMFTACSDHDIILTSLSAGACGYLVKPASAEQLVNALVSAAKGEPALGKEAQSAMISTFHRAAAVKASFAMTKREQEIITCLVQNLSNKEIADRLQISHHTVHVHLGKLFKKLGIRKREEAARKILQST